MHVAFSLDPLSLSESQILLTRYLIEPSFLLHPSYKQTVPLSTLGLRFKEAMWRRKKQDLLPMNSAFSSSLPAGKKSRADKG